MPLLLAPKRSFLSFRAAAWVAVFTAGTACALFGTSCSSSSADGAPAPDAASDDATPDTAAFDSALGAPRDSGAPDTTDSADAGSCPGASDAAVDGATVAEGLALVTANHCAGCHQETPADSGVELSGRTTPLGGPGTVYPKNLTPDPTTGIGCWTDEQLKRAILDGIDDEGKPLCVMPKFSKVGLSDENATAIAVFLRSQPAVPKVIPDTVCPPGDGGTDTGDGATGD